MQTENKALLKKDNKIKTVKNSDILLEEKQN